MGKPEGERSKSKKSGGTLKADPATTEVIPRAPAVVMARFVTPIDLDADEILTGTSILSPGNASASEIDRVYS